jgi:hypothetical protein
MVLTELQNKKLRKAFLSVYTPETSRTILKKEFLDQAIKLNIPGCT